MIRAEIHIGDGAQPIFFDATPYFSERATVEDLSEFVDCGWTDYPLLYVASYVSRLPGYESIASLLEHGGARVTCSVYSADTLNWMHAYRPQVYAGFAALRPNHSHVIEGPDAGGGPWWPWFELEGEEASDFLPTRCNIVEPPADMKVGTLLPYEGSAADFRATIETNATVALAAMRATGRLLLRGLSRPTSPLFFGLPPASREPKHVPQYLHHAMLEWMLDHGFRAHRGNSIYCSGDPAKIAAYGAPCLIIPSNNCAVVWSRRYPDLSIHMTDLHNRQITGGAHLAPEQIEAELEAAGLVSGCLQEALESGHEILVASRYANSEDPLLRGLYYGVSLDESAGMENIDAILNRL